jgi:hypothetical protein
MDPAHSERYVALFLYVLYRQHMILVHYFRYVHFFLQAC